MRRRPASTRYSRELAKKMGVGTPKKYATKKYKELAKKMGKTGREVFRLTKGMGPKGEGTGISKGDPYSLELEKKMPRRITARWI